MNLLTNCHDCAAKPGEHHKDGCDVERCSDCGGQFISCGCGNATHDKDFAKWNGIWPGLAEAQHLGMDLNQFGEYSDIFFVKHAVSAPGVKE